MGATAIISLATNLMGLTKKDDNNSQMQQALAAGSQPIKADNSAMILVGIVMIGVMVTFFYLLKK